VKREYLLAVFTVAACTGICFLIFPRAELTNLVMVYLLGTLAVAARGYRGPAALTSALSVLLFDFFFVPPRFTFSVSDTQYLWTFVVMFAVAMSISHLTIRLREEAEAAKRGQKQTGMMHAFTQLLANTRSPGKTLRVAADHVAETFAGEVTIFVPGSTGGLQAAVRTCPEELSDKQHAVAQWVYDSGQHAGMGTDSLPDAEAIYVPILGAEGPVGVVSMKPLVRRNRPDPDQRKLLDSFAHQIGMALEVERFQDNARKAEMEAEAEGMRSSLLSSVSHDFRTPLAAIMGSADALLGKEELLSNDAARELLENIQVEGERLSRLVQNVLEITRLESDKVKIQKALYPLEEVVGSSLERVEKLLEGRNVKTDIPEDLPLVPLDPVLIDQLLINLLENAARHTPSGKSVEISAGKFGESVSVTVADEGTGLKPDHLDHIFDKFYRDPSSPGAGLGLSICRAIVTAHGGRIWAENRPGGGAVFRFSLPLK
jgi:two-component system sensor histidine kinase KdpD